MARRWSDIVRINPPVASGAGKTLVAVKVNIFEWDHAWFYAASWRGAKAVEPYWLHDFGHEMIAALAAIGAVREHFEADDRDHCEWDSDKYEYRAIAVAEDECGGGWVVTVAVTKKEPADVE